MKAFLVVVIVIVGLLFGAVSLFGNYNANNVLDNQASFEIFIDSNSFDIDEYFDLPQGTFKQEEHLFVCRLPLAIEGFKARYATVGTNISEIDCDANFDERENVKYEPYELQGTTFKLMLVNKYTNLGTLDSPLMERNIVAEKEQAYVYSKGEVNRILVTNKGLSNHCK